MVALSHSGRQTCLDAARAASAPICISHTGCRALVDYPRNKTDEELRLVADKGGFVGIYFMPFLAHERQIPSADVIARSKERRVGKECVSTCRSRCSP